MGIKDTLNKDQARSEEGYRNRLLPLIANPNRRYLLPSLQRKASFRTNHIWYYVLDHYSLAHSGAKRVAF